MQAHAPEHIYNDVKVFTEGRGFCHQCNAVHCITAETMKIDWLTCGPSCKDVSPLSASDAVSTLAVSAVAYAARQ